MYHKGLIVSVELCGRCEAQQKEAKRASRARAAAAATVLQRLLHRHQGGCLAFVLL